MRCKTLSSLLRPAALVAALLSTSCTANRMYRPASVEETPDYSLAFIEFDDQGELWAPSQLDRALELLERTNRSPTGVALIVFIHGWNNSAAPSEELADDGTIYQFRELLTRLKRNHRLRHPELDIPVVGMYLSWRGEVSKVPLVRQLSFYNRRGAAERIAGPAATEAIYRILTTMRTNSWSRSVLIGHSFGSMVLERALSQAVVSALLASPGEELIFPADLVVLVNPAGSAIQTKQLVDILARNRLKTYRFDEAGNRYERPLLLSFTSQTDAATRRYFPLGMGLKAMSKKFRSYGSEYCSPISNQRWLYSHTAGHTPALFSHTVSVGPILEPDRTPQTTTEEGEPPPRYFEEYDPISQQMAFSFDGEEYRFTIKRKPRGLNDTPYWIMQAPKELIPNHSEIFSTDTFKLVEAALAFSGALQADATTTVVREDGVRPVAIVPLPNGAALFVDRSRGVYAVGAKSSRPVFLSCLTEGDDPSDAIGFHVAGNLVYVVLTTSAGAPGSKCQTEVKEFQLEPGGYQQIEESRIDRPDCFDAAAIDVPGKRVFLSLSGSEKSGLYVADLSRESPGATKWMDLPGDLPATKLYYDPEAHRLFSAQGETGQIWVMDPDSDPPHLTLLDEPLGSAVALDYDRVTRKLYVTDSKNEKIWVLDCQGQCTTPTVFLESTSLKNPTSISVGPDGTLWLGDLVNQTLTAYAPDGTIKNSITSLARASPYPTTPPN